MPLPIVAIVGRPNVGKSTLFNKLAGRRIAIVEPTAGVTRDRISTVIKINDLAFDLIDTGGIGIVDSDALESHIEKQIQTAIEQADVILFTLDVRDGLMPLDLEVIKRLRHLSRPMVVVANKSDTKAFDIGSMDFYGLGIEEVYPVSAKTGRGIDDLLDTLSELVPHTGEKAPVADMKIAIVGRRNVGKSTLLNSIAQEDRVIVSEIPGTTRDSVDIRFEKDNKTYIAIDTAGIRKHSKIANAIEHFSQKRVETSIRRADVIVLVLDVNADVGRIDKKLAAFIEDQKKPVVIAANKWDLVKDRITTEQFADYVSKKLPGIMFAPIVFISAIENKNVQSLLDISRHVYKQASKQATTGAINRALNAIRKRRPRSRGQKRVGKVFYATQVNVRPPTILVFVNNPALFPANFVRSIENAFREDLDFEEVPMKVVLRKRM